MNKNRYKLVFSKAKSCLVPVAEFINSVTENNKSEKKNGKKEQESYRLSFLSQSIQEIVRHVLALPILLSLPAMATANPIEVDPNHKDKVSVEITSNNVAIIDIAKPEHDGISDNRFNKFNVENGAVFKNNKQADTSTLVGYQEKSKHLRDQSAKAILAQVTGHEETKLKGGLEVLGDKADLLIVNPNGVSVNGVRTFNTDRLVISTSNVIDPKKGLHLSVDKGQVSIEENGLATDGLRYVDIVAKKINQKGAIKHNTKTTLNPANINLVAGSSDYDVEKRTAKSKNVHNEEVILTGAETGSMYGDKVQFIVTDKGAGVHHKGIILSEADIVIESQGGKVSIETIQAKNVIDIKKAKNVEVNNKLEGRYILVDAKQTDLKKNASLKAGENILIDSSVNLENASKVRAKRVNISGENTKVSENATIIGHTITLDSKIDNKGTISARNTRITSKNLKNTGDILAEDELYLSVHGVKKMNDSQNVIENNYTNSGTIQSKNNAELIFLDNTSFSANLHGNLPQAKNTLKIISDDFTVEKDKEIQVANNLTIISNNLLNNGLITAFNTLDISAGRKATNNGLIGAGKSVKLNAIDIHNGEKGIFHSEGTTYLDAAFDFINDGKILSRKKLTLSASHLVNNATVTGDVIGKRYFVGSSSTNPRNLLRYDVYKIGGWIEELEGLNIKIKSMGHILSEDGFEFIQRDNKNPNESGIDNYGIINIKGEFFNNGTTRIRNNAKGISKDLGYHYFQKDNNASFLLRFQPFGRFGFISNPLSGESVYPFSSLKGLLDHLLYNEEAIKSSSLYSGYSSEYLKILKNIQSPQLQKVLTQVFGQDWESRDLQDLRRKWASAKRNPLLVEFYPDTQAKILADSITGSIQNIQNGNNGITNKFDSTLSAGNTKIVLPKVTFKNISSQSQDSSSDIDLSVLADLLGETNLFIDRSLQLQKPKPPVFNPNDEDKKLLEETEQEKLERIRKAKEEAERLLEEERQRKAQKAKEEKERQERIAKERREKAEKELQERQRKEREALEDEQSRLKAEKKRLEELERKSRELAERQRQEKLALEEKLRKEQEEAERKLQEEQLAREKAEEQKRQEEELRLKEYRAKLEQERRKAEELANQRALLENANRPRVEVDPLYHTRVKYIKQEEYVGADYFFNKVASEVKGQNKVTVIGDNYFQHQLITRTIEKKVDNHLSLKYDLNNRDLVKRLMDNAVNKSQELNLTVGQALTKEQQASLKEDIIWYVKSEVNGKEVFIPQVYLAPETLADAKKYQGLGQAVIKARDIELKSKEFNNAGSVIANKIDIEAEGKIINSGDILSREKTKLKGLEGVELISQTVTNDQGNTVTEKANVISEGHVHLEAGLDKNVDLKAANVKGKTGFIKSKDLNVQDTYEVKTTHKSKEIKSRFSGLNVGVETLDKVDVNSVGSDVKFEHLHLALKGDLNQQGSKIDTDKTTGIVQGNINTKAGKNYSHSERTESILSLELAGGASALGHSTQISANEYSDPSIKSGPSDNAGVNADLGLALSNKIEAEALLKHKNSEFNAKSGKLHVLGNADIGGVDINKSGNELSQDKQSDKAKPSKEVAAEVANTSLEEARKQKQKDLQALSKEQIADLMAEKGEDFYAKERSKKDEGFTLSAGSISSTKEKDSYFKAEAGFKVKVGVEAEGHSAAADFATGIAKHVNDKKQGLKQDGTVALQHASEALGLVTGDLVGGSVKRKIEFDASASVLRDKQDVRTHIGGKTSLIARDGDITLNNVQSDENSELSLTAKENININAGEREQKENATAVSEKIFDGATSSCGVMSKGCTVGVTGGVEASVHISNSDKKEVQNSELLSKKVTINAGKDLNLNGANIRTKQLNIDVEGTTNIISKQDHIERSEHSINAGATGGASINTALEITPTGTISAGYGYEYEKGNKINKQSGIIADRIVGELNDVNLSAGHIVDHNKGKDVVIKGNVTHQNVEESYHKDGGHGGGTVGINERGTAQLSLRGGRAEQHHYDATQKSTLDGIKSEDTSINTDINKAKEVHRDDRIAKSKFEFEILDAVELGQKARDKVKSHSSKLNDNSQNSTRNRPLVQEDSASSNKVAETNPNNQAKRVLPELPTENSTKQKVESDYEEISAFTPKAKSAEVESDYADISTFAPKAKANEVESDYAEIPNLTPKNTDIATPQPKSKAELEDLYAKVDKSPEARAKAEQRSAEAEAKQPKKAVVEADDTPPALPPRPQAEENPYATIDKSPEARAKAEQRSAEAEAKQPKKAVVEADDTPPALPPRPQAEENPYATIDKSPEARAKAEQRSAEAEAKQPKKAVVEADDTPPVLPPRPQAEENPYATIDKSPEARAKAEQRSVEAEAKQPKKAVVEADDTPPALPPRPQADVSKAVVEKADVAKPSEETAAPVVTEKKAESESFLSKVKKFFKGSDSDKAKKSPKTETKAESKASDAEPNYDNLPDSANLKGLLSLEKQRNADFGEQVLKNPQFLAEAKEAAKKYIPESTIKQMGDSPEFNDILTEGARKVEQRINDAVTFKPTAEEFNAIQNLVKELPKGTVITDTKVATDSVTEALASTSKTIQKNPELKEQIRGAIEEFLVKSKDQDLTVEMIEKLNHGLRPDEGADRVLYKKETLTKENAVFSSPESSKIQLKATVDFINQARKNGVEPSVLAGLVYQRLIAYHPFAEGNGRMARVIVNKLLLDAGYPPFTKFNESFETQIIPQTNTTAKSASSSEVVKEFLKELSQKNLPAGSEALPKLQKTEENAPLVAPKVESQTEATTKKATPIDDKVQASTLVEKPRSALQQVKDKFQPLRVGKKIKEVRNSVEQYGGEVSFKYAQSKGEVFNEIIKHSETEHGTCEATCAFWIAKKVNDDQSLFKEIYPNGKEGKLDKQAFEKIKKLQTEFINSGSSATQQFKFTESWLNEQGAKVKQKQVGEYSRKDEVSGTVTNTEVKSLINAILDTGDSHSGVKKISINLEGGSHTVAASVKGEQVIFFDPNFGEITFKKREHFENWFKEAFWSKSGYAGTNSGKRFFNVINYDAK
ncbi:YopT-type cysteine protease domain-containing protein [Frederiksenia canicola]|uniref:Filamentous hemagglutinin n=1 Tax=Frederiksenia canicola TaxID=123824 RepID=A0AAE6X6G4_9PAST|nr:YopT-type cysteine protease domain-containing protein [Frederiksenia canicola]QIM64766.1 hypothetical protein A4G17_04605 [Frederiksenia canicola]RPE92313.1 filamentous hemagglutinin [Frederiksenia canicola]